MKKIIAVIVALLAAFVAVLCLNRVSPGNVGVVYSPSGVEDTLLTQGWKFRSPVEKVKQFPISQQQLVLSNNPGDYNQKDHQDWSIDAPANGGMVKINMTVNYNFIPERVIELYKKFNGMDGEAIVDTMVQNSIVAYIKEVTPKFSVMDIYSDKRADVSSAITEYLNSKLVKEYGISVSSALIIDVQLNDALMEKIQAKEQAKQDAEKAELDRKTAVAQSETNKAIAESKAAVEIIEANAEAESNRIISQSVTPELIEMKNAEARLKHGWVTVQGAGSLIVDKN